jgi:hypothetical protein
LSVTTPPLRRILAYRAERPAARRFVRLARIVALAVIIAIGINHIWWAVADWHLRDMNAYWDAAMRLRNGQELFNPTGIEASEVYRYSPWFAWLWVPVTFLPRIVANIGWSVILLGASAVAVWPLVKRGSLLGIAFFLPMLIGITAIGNVHSLLIAMLVLGVERRSGPLWIAIAASLKIVPIILVATYLGRRQWMRAGLTIALTAVLAGPFLLYDLTNYVTDAGGAALLWTFPVAYILAVASAGIAALWLAATRYAWLASSLAVTLALPRFFLYDVLYLLVGTTAPAPSRERTSRSASRTE